MRHDHKWTTRMSAERLDVLEEDLPRAICSVRGCDNGTVKEWAGTFGVRWICYRHYPAYRKHAELVRRVRAL